MTEMFDYPDYDIYTLLDEGNEYVIMKNGEAIYTASSPEDAEQIMWLMHQVDLALAALHQIAFKDDSPENANVKSVAHFAWVEIKANLECEIPDRWNASEGSDS